MGPVTASKRDNTAGYGDEQTGYHGGTGLELCLHGITVSRRCPNCSPPRQPAGNTFENANDTFEKFLR